MNRRMRVNNRKHCVLRQLGYNGSKRGWTALPGDIKCNLLPLGGSY
jgi:hypothetical protein